MSTFKKQLKFFETGEWQVIEERLADATKAGKVWCPGSKNLFKALEITPLEKTRVMFCGQDPYPDPTLATGLAFSVPETSKRIPPTLANMYKEYCSDLHYPYPANGSLVPWANQGVLLWNVIPTCEAHKSLSHEWVEWRLLTEEIIRKLADQAGTVFVFFGGKAREYAKLVPPWEDVIEVSHPSPRGSRAAKHPFFGSRIFSTINDRLVSQGLKAIDWKL